MKSRRIILICLLTLSISGLGCKSLNNTKKGTAIGVASGAVIGGVVGRASGNTALGALIGATLGGAAGAIIGNKMDKQAEEIRNEVPGATVYRIGEGIIVEFNGKILFGFDQSELNPIAKENLGNLITVLNKYPDTDIEVQGHTDNTGTRNYNMQLSERRATVVSNFLNARGISSERLTIKGYGESAPNYTNDTEDGKAKNRRVEFLITANEKMRAEAVKETK